MSNGLFWEYIYLQIILVFPTVAYAAHCNTVRNPRFEILVYLCPMSVCVRAWFCIGISNTWQTLISTPVKHDDRKFHFPLMPTTSKQTPFNINIMFHTRFRPPHPHTNAPKASSQVPEASWFEHLYSIQCGDCYVWRAIFNYELNWKWNENETPTSLPPPHS